MGERDKNLTSAAQLAATFCPALIRLEDIHTKLYQGIEIVKLLIDNYNQVRQRENSIVISKFPFYANQASSKYVAIIFVCVMFSYL